MCTRVSRFAEANALRYLKMPASLKGPNKWSKVGQFPYNTGWAANQKFLGRRVVDLGSMKMRPLSPYYTMERILMHPKMPSPGGTLYPILAPGYIYT